MQYIVGTKPHKGKEPSIEIVMREKVHWKLWWILNQWNN